MPGTCPEGVPGHEEAVGARACTPTRRSADLTPGTCPSGVPGRKAALRRGPAWRGRSPLGRAAYL
eukprot:7133646-Lingulodinium_polyedra.AAC.1